ncbi:MAG: CorA family divalent cation transporter [Hydrogenovibrio sp.]
MQHLHDGIGPTDSAALLIRLADELIMMMGDTVDELEDKIGELESLTLTADATELKSELAALRRQTITIKRYLAPKREAMGRLLIERVSWLTPQHRMHLREVKDRLIRHIEDIDAVRERTAVAHEELLSRASEQLSERMYILAIVTAVFLPLGFFTGLLGVNLNGIPGSDSPYAFPAFALSLLCVLGMQFLYFKKRKWI